MADAPAYQPRWTVGQPGGSQILDRNLREIASALSNAFGTINDLRTTIVNITGGDTSITIAPTPPATPPGIDMGGDFDTDVPMVINAAAGISQARFWLSIANPSLPYGVNLGVLGNGTLQQTVSAGVSTPTVFAGTTGSIPFYVAGNQLSQDNAGLFWNAAGAYMVFGKAAAQVIQKEGTGGFYVGTLGAEELGLYTNNITRATISSAGKLTYSTSTGLVFDPSTNTMTIGTSTPLGGAVFQATKNQNAGTSFAFTNSSAGGSAYSNFILGQSDNFSSGAYFAMSLYSSGSTFGVPYGVNNGTFELGGGSGNMNFWIDQNAGDFVVFTKATFPNPPERLRIKNDGDFRFSNAPTVSFSSGASIAPTAPTVVEWAVTPPSTVSAATIGALHSYDAETLTLTGSTTVDSMRKFYLAAPTVTDASAVTVTKGATLAIGGAPISAGSATILTSLALDIESGAFTHHNATGANAERILGFWFSNVWNLKSSAIGSGTVRAMVITSTAGVTVDEFLQVNGVTASSNNSFVVGATTNTDRGHVHFYVGAGTIQDGGGTGANALLTVHTLGTTIPAGTTAGIWSTVSVLKGTFTGASSPIITEATTLYVDGAPTVTSASAGARYALHVAAGPSLVAGDVRIGDFTGAFVDVTNGAAQAIGFTTQATIASGAGVGFGGINTGLTATITGSTNITNTAGFNAIDINTPAYSSGSALTITHAATLHIVAAPAPSGSLTITNPYALWIDAGRVRWDGQVALGDGAAATLGTIGGSGPGTAAQNKWLPVNSDGTTYYIPLWI